MRAWRYHPDYEPKIFEGEAIDIAERAGWFDTPAKFPKGKGGDTSSTIEIPEDLTELTVKQLKQLCKDRGLSGYSRLKEAELIALLKG